MSKYEFLHDTDPSELLHCLQPTPIVIAFDYDDDRKEREIIKVLLETAKHRIQTNSKLYNLLDLYKMIHTEEEIYREIYNSFTPKYKYESIYPKRVM